MREFPWSSFSRGALRILKQQGGCSAACRLHDVDLRHVPEVLAAIKPPRLCERVCVSVCVFCISQDDLLDTTDTMSH